MGNAAFFYYAAGSAGGFTEIDLGGPVSDLFTSPVRLSSSGRSMGGDFQRVSWGSTLRVTITLGPFNDSGARKHLPHKLMSMSAHLERGGRVCFTADRSQMLFAPLNQVPSPGDGGVFHVPNLMKTFEPTADPIPGTSYVVVENVDPQGNREYLRVLSIMPDAAVVFDSEVIQYEYDSGAPVWVRDRDTYPSMYLPQDQMGRAFLTHDHRVTFTLDLTLELDVASLAGLSDQGTDVVLDGPFQQYDPGGSNSDKWQLEWVGQRGSLDGPTDIYGRPWSGKRGQ